MRAPPSPGQYWSQWSLYSSAGIPFKFGETLWCVVHVADTEQQVLQQLSNLHPYGPSAGDAPS